MTGLILPNRFALGAANGEPSRRRTFWKSGWEVTRTAMVSEPAVTRSGTSGCLGRIRVKGPGQKAEARLSTRFRCSKEVNRTTLFNHPTSGRWTIKGSVRGRPLASKIRATAKGWKTSAARPYTVSVGNPTTPPLRRISADSSTPSSPLRVRALNVVEDAVGSTRAAEFLWGFQSACRGGLGLGASEFLQPESQPRMQERQL